MIVNERKPTEKDHSRSATLQSAEIKPVFQTHMSNQQTGMSNRNFAFNSNENETFQQAVVSAYSKLFKITQPSQLPRRIPGLAITKHHRIWETSRYSNLNWSAKDVAYQIKLNNYLASKMRQRRFKHHGAARK